jgi:hypothetical protein
MSNETTRRYPRTMHQAFNCDCNPISGPYGKASVWPFVAVAAIAAVAVFLGLIFIWRIV